MPRLPSASNERKGAGRTFGQTRQIAAKLEYGARRLLALAKAGARQDEAHFLPRNVEAREQTPQQQRDLRSPGAPIHVSFVENDDQFILWVMVEPLTGLGKYVPLNGAHEHVFKHRI